jgi:hypothetical protein
MIGSSALAVVVGGIIPAEDRGANAPPAKARPAGRGFSRRAFGYVGSREPFPARSAYVPSEGARWWMRAVIAGEVPEGVPT